MGGLLGKADSSAGTNSADALLNSVLDNIAAKYNKKNDDQLTLTEVQHFLRELLVRGGIRPTQEDLNKLTEKGFGSTNAKFAMTLASLRKAIKSYVVEREQLAVSSALKDIYYQQNIRNGIKESIAQSAAKQIQLPAYKRPPLINNGQDYTTEADCRQNRVVYSAPFSSDLRFAGYAETINGGKSSKNEDNSLVMECETFGLSCNSTKQLISLYGIFDGHAGPETALFCVENLGKVLKESISASAALYADKETVQEKLKLLGGILSSSYHIIDNFAYDAGVPAGSTAIVILATLGHVVVANAGDCRAVCVRNVLPTNFSYREDSAAVQQSLSSKDEAAQPEQEESYSNNNNTPSEDEACEAIALSEDHKPLNELQRMQRVGYLQPHLLGSLFRRKYFDKRFDSADVGTYHVGRDFFSDQEMMLCVTSNDVKRDNIIISGRVFGKIAATRGIGDHQLTAADNTTLIKPFLSCTPDITITKFESANDIIVVGSDGLWDVIENAELLELIPQFISRWSSFDSESVDVSTGDVATEMENARNGCLSFIAYKLVELAKSRKSGDDITAFVIQPPLFK